MDEYLEQRIRERKREYHRKWRAEHPEKVKAAQMRYWARQVERIQQAHTPTNGGPGPSGKETA